MEINLLYFSLIILIAYVGLRVFTWRQLLTDAKSSYWTRNLIQTGNKESEIVKSAYWTRDLIRSDLMV